MVGILAVALAGSAQAATMFAVQNAGGTQDMFAVQDDGTATTVAKMGVGNTIAPISTMTVVDQTTAATRGLGIYQANSTPAAGIMDFRKMRGSYTATPTVANSVVAGDYVGALHGWGVDAAGVWQRGATINYYVDGTVASNSVPLAILLSTGSNDSAGAFPNSKQPRLTIGSNGKLAFGYGYVPLSNPTVAVMATTSGNNIIDMNSDAIRVAQSRTPATSADTCFQGEIAWDANYVYVCTANNSWKRTALATW